MISQTQDKMRIYILPFLLVIVIFAFHTRWPEIIPAGNGVGYDGTVYAEMVTRLDEMVKQDQLSAYYAQKMLPSLIARTWVGLLGITATNNNIIQIFIIMNLILVLISAGFWVAITRRLNLGTTAFLIGASGIVLFYLNAKQIYYNPVMTDAYGLMTGCGLVYATISRRLPLICILSVFGAFAWQMSSAVGALLAIALLFEFQKAPPGARLFVENKRVLYGIISFSLFISLTVAASSVALSMMGAERKRNFLGRILTFDFTRVLTNSPTLLLIGLGALSILVAAYLAKPRLAARPLKIAAHMAVAGLIIAIPAVIIRSISNPDIPAPGLQGVREILAALLVDRVSDRMVLLPFIAHAVYYGPVFLLLIAKWPDTVRSATTLGPSVTLMLLLFIGLSGFSESRFTLLLWPFVVTIVAKTQDGRAIGAAFVIAFTALTAIYSRFWLRINQAPWPKPDYGFLDQWPKSIYFSPYGPWMNWHFYIGQGFLVAVSLGVLVWTMQGSRSSAGLATSKLDGK